MPKAPQRSTPVRAEHRFQTHCVVIEIAPERLRLRAHVAGTNRIVVWLLPLLALVLCTMAYFLTGLIGAIPAGLLGLVALLLPAALSFVYSHRPDVLLDATTGIARTDQRWMLWRSRVELPLATVDGLRVEKSAATFDGARIEAWKPYLVTRRGDVPISILGTPDPDYCRLFVATIEPWLAARREKARAASRRNGEIVDKTR
jgi:hypothetical protein